MTILQSSGITGRIDAILVNHRRGGERNATAVERSRASYAGLEGDCYASLTRPACVRTKEQYAVGTPIRNVRQITIISAEELAEIGVAMGLPEPVKPAWVRANLVVSGIPRFTQIPPSSRLIVNNGAALVVDVENEACAFPGKLIEEPYPGFGRHFAKAAFGRRGVTAWIEREGNLSTGDEIALHLPPQRLYDVAPGR